MYPKPELIVASVSPRSNVTNASGVVAICKWHLNYRTIWYRQMIENERLKPQVNLLKTETVVQVEVIAH